MGDRANIVLIQDGTPLYLYSHWGGTDFQTDKLADALTVAKPRWDDSEYCARILIGELFKDLIGLTTGGGIGPHETDYNYNHVVVSLDSNTIWFARPGKDLFSPLPVPNLKKNVNGTLSWGDFITACHEKTWQRQEILNILNA